VQLFRVTRRVEYPSGRVDVREYLAEIEDAWHLWSWLTMMDLEEPSRRAQRGKERQETALSLSGDPPKCSVRVFNINGREVCPEDGVDGLRSFKNPKAREAEAAAGTLPATRPMAGRP
jgi:hypothetical protein